jgi:hypothetical protein
MLAAVLRSWEDWLGAVVVEVGFAHIRLPARRIRERERCR